MSRVRIDGRRFREAVEAEIARRRLSAPITVRNLTVDFEARTITMDGQTYAIKPETRCVTMPILNTEQLVIPR